MIPKDLIRSDGLKFTPFSQFTECSVVVVIGIPRFLTASVEVKALIADVLSWFTEPLKVLQNGLAWVLCISSTGGGGSI